MPPSPWLVRCSTPPTHLSCGPSRVWFWVKDTWWGPPICYQRPFSLARARPTSHQKHARVVDQHVQGLPASFPLFREASDRRQREEIQAHHLRRIPRVIRMLEIEVEAYVSSAHDTSTRTSLLSCASRCQVRTISSADLVFLQARVTWAPAMASSLLYGKFNKSLRLIIKSGINRQTGKLDFLFVSET